MNNFFRLRGLNDEVGCAAAPNAYDAKLSGGKASGVAAIKS